MSPQFKHITCKRLKEIPVFPRHPNPAIWRPQYLHEFITEPNRTQAGLDDSYRPYHETDTFSYDFPYPEPDNAPPPIFEFDEQSFPPLPTRTAPRQQPNVNHQGGLTHSDEGYHSDGTNIQERDIVDSDEDGFGLRRGNENTPLVSEGDRVQSDDHYCSESGKEDREYQPLFEIDTSGSDDENTPLLGEGNRDHPDDHYSSENEHENTLPPRENHNDDSETDNEKDADDGDIDETIFTWEDFFRVNVRLIRARDPVTWFLNVVCLVGMSAFCGVFGD